MKRTPIRRVSLKQRQRAAEAPKVPKFARCCWCLARAATEMDHVIPRSLLPGENRDHKLNLLPSCHRCNVGRASGEKPLWGRLDPKRQEWVLQQKGPWFACRYFLTPVGFESVD